MYRSPSFAVMMMALLATQLVAAQDPAPLDYSSYKPPVCIAAGDRCYYRLLPPDELTNRFDACCNGMSCVGSKWWATCQQVSTNLPPLDPKGPDYGLITVSAAYTGNENCPDQMNLGPLLSKSTCYLNPFPLLQSPPNLDSPAGREYEVGFLVGGNYFAPLAAEIEGNIVILGDFKVGSRGTNSLGT